MPKKRTLSCLDSYWARVLLAGVFLVFSLVAFYLFRDEAEESVSKTTDTHSPDSNEDGSAFRVLEAEEAGDSVSALPREEPSAAPTSGSGSGNEKTHKDLDSGSISEWEGSLEEVFKKYDLGDGVLTMAPVLGIELGVSARLSERFASSPRFKCIETADQRTFTFTTKGVFLTYIDTNAENIPDELMHLDAFTKDEVLQTVHAAVSGLGIDVDYSKSWMKLVDNGGSTPDDLMGASYEFGMGLSYKDYRTVAMVMASASAYTGKIKSFSTIPLVIPESLALDLTEQDALGRAKEFAESNQFTEPTFEVDPEKWIVPPNPQVWTGPPYWGPDYDVGRVVYRVYVEGATNGYLDVDGITGEMIGGHVNREHQHMRR